MHLLNEEVWSQCRGPELPESGETSGRQGEKNSGTRIEVGVEGQKMSKMWTPPPHSLVLSDTQGWQLWGRQDRGQEEGLWETGKESKHDSTTVQPITPEAEAGGPQVPCQPQ